MFLDYFDLLILKKERKKKNIVSKQVSRREGHHML